MSNKHHRSSLHVNRKDYAKSKYKKKTKSRTKQQLKINIKDYNEYQHETLGIPVHWSEYWETRAREELCWHAEFTIDDICIHAEFTIDKKTMKELIETANDACFLLAVTPVTIGPQWIEDYWFTVPFNEQELHNFRLIIDREMDQRESEIYNELKYIKGHIAQFHHRSAFITHISAVMHNYLPYDIVLVITEFVSDVFPMAPFENCKYYNINDFPGLAYYNNLKQRWFAHAYNESNNYPIISKYSVEDIYYYKQVESTKYSAIKCSKDIYCQVSVGKVKYWNKFCYFYAICMRQYGVSQSIVEWSFDWGELWAHCIKSDYVKCGCYKYLLTKH